MWKFTENKKITITAIVLLSSLITVIFSAFIGHWITLQEYDCSGIGGFVYREIEWAEQTYNVVSKCRNLNGMDIPVLYYNDDLKQFYCYKQTDCTKDGCRSKKVYLNPIIDKFDCARWRCHKQDNDYKMDYVDFDKCEQYFRTSDYKYKAVCGDELNWEVKE